MKPPEEEPPRPGCGAGRREFVGSSGQKVESQHHNASAEDRRCPGCSCPVDNNNEGGHSGAGALSGILWCDRCSDGPAKPLAKILTPAEMVIAIHQRRIADEIREREWAREWIEGRDAPIREDLQKAFEERWHLEDVANSIKLALGLLNIDPECPHKQKNLLLLAQELRRDAIVFVHNLGWTRPILL